MLMQLLQGKGRTVKVILNKLCVVLSERQQLNFCTEIMFISRAIPISAKDSTNYVSLCKALP